MRGREKEERGRGKGCSSRKLIQAEVNGGGKEWYLKKKGK